LPSCAALATALVTFSSAALADLAPPPPIDPTAPATPPGGEVAQTNAKLDAAEKEDSGRNFELFWFNGDVGGSYINMQQFDQTSMQIEKAKAGGPMFALGAGLRLVVLSLGVRARYHALSAFSMWQLNGELGFKLPVRQFDVLIGAHGGWAWLGSLSSGSLTTTSPTTTQSAEAVQKSANDVSVRGFNAGLELGFDYFIVPSFSVGAGFNGDFLFLKRPPVPIPADTPPEVRAQIQAEPAYQNSGTSVGFGLGGALRLGLHLGI
jgi:hypothetical protein